MDLLLMLLRLLLGLPRREESEPQPVAVRPDGTTVTLPPGASQIVGLHHHRDWLKLLLPFVNRPQSNSSTTAGSSNTVSAAVHRSTRGVRRRVLSSGYFKRQVFRAARR